MNNAARVIPYDWPETDLIQFAENKVIPDTLRKEILTALSYYPELKGVKIRFVFKDNMKRAFKQTEPLVKTIFGRRSQRAYVIFISHYFNIGHKRIFIHSVPFGAIVGLLGHELGHVMDYKDRNFFSMLKVGFRHILSNTYLTGAERMADIHAIQHGLENRMIETRNYILSHADVPERYKSKILRLHMSLEEVMTLAGSV